MIYSPCKGCERREVGCHSKCAEYIDFRSALNQINLEKIEKLKQNDVLYAPCLSSKSSRLRKAIKDRTRK